MVIVSFQVHKLSGLVAQLVEQRIENPCVGGSIPSRATIFLLQFIKVNQYEFSF